MAQLSLRLDDDLHRRATFAARVAGTSLNAYIARVLRIATDPSASEPEGTVIRLRLFEAGLLPTADVPAPALSEAELAEFQRIRDGMKPGTLASDLISEDRGER